MLYLGSNPTGGMKIYQPAYKVIEVIAVIGAITNLFMYKCK
jgi:hypothetical protein